MILGLDEHELLQYWRSRYEIQDVKYLMEEALPQPTILSSEFHYDRQYERLESSYPEGLGAQ